MNTLRKLYETFLAGYDRGMTRLKYLDATLKGVLQLPEVNAGDHESAFVMDRHFNQADSLDRRFKTLTRRYDGGRLAERIAFVIGEGAGIASNLIQDDFTELRKKYQKIK